MTKGDIVLITFPFTDLSGTKLRPAIVLFQNDTDVTVCFITSKLDWKEEFDITLNPSVENGLRKKSLIRVAKIATLDKSFAKGLLGRLTQEELMLLNKKLTELLLL